MKTQSKEAEEVRDVKNHFSTTFYFYTQPVITLEQLSLSLQHNKKSPFFQVITKMSLQI